MRTTLFQVSFIIVLSCVLLPLGIRAEGSLPPQSAGAKKGFELLTRKPFTEGVFGASVIEELWRVWEPELRAKAESATPEERRKLVWDRYGFIPRDFDDSGLPLGYVQDEANGMLASNCLNCHGGMIAGKPVPGAGNAYLDFTTLAEDGLALRKLKRAEAAGIPEGQASAGGGPLLPGMKFNISKGGTNAFGFSVMLASFRDKDMNLTKFHSFGRVPDHDEDPPAWWTYKKKSRIYWTGFGRPSPRELMQFVMAPENTGEEIRGFEADFQFIEQYIRELEPPKWPHKVDAKLAAEGRELFEITCAQCHGTYGENSEYPNKVVPLAEIGTDPVRAQALPKAWKEFFNESWITHYGEIPFDVEETGYLAQPLDGIWASAPYFHNGSVPTLHHVLHPEERPAVFTRNPNKYDEIRVGLAIEVFESKPAGLSRAQAREYYDTSDPSHGNGGHLYPNELNAEEKRAVLEYLKTL